MEMTAANAQEAFMTPTDIVVSPAASQPPAGFETPPGSPGTRGPAAPIGVEGCDAGADSGPTTENDRAPFGKAGHGPDTRRRDLPMPHHTLIEELDRAFDDAVLELLWMCISERRACPPKVRDAADRAYTICRDIQNLRQIQRLDRDSQPCDGTDKAGWATARRQAIRHTWGVG